MIGHNVKRYHRLRLNYVKANLSQARLHNRANRVRDLARVAVDRNLLVCECCNLPAVLTPQNAPQFPLLCSISDLNELGVGFPLFFYFLRFSLCILILLTVRCRQCIAGVPCAVDNYTQGKGVYWSNGVDTWYVNLSVGGYGENYDRVVWWQGLLHVCGAVTVLFTYWWFRSFLYKRVETLSADDLRPSHFCVWVKNLRPDFDCAELEEFLINHGSAVISTQDGQKTEVFSINLAYDLTLYLEIINRLIDLHERKMYLEAMVATNKSTTSQGKFTSVQPELQEITSTITREEELLKSEQSLFRIGCKDRQVGQAFVTFRKQTDARKISQTWGKTNSQLFCRFLSHKLCCCNPDDVVDSYFIARLAPEPSDVIWENLCVGWYYRQFRRGVTWVLVLTMIAGNFYAMIWLKSLQKTLFSSFHSGESSLHYYLFTAFSFLISVSIVFSNKVLSVLTRVLTAKEAHHSWTHFYESVAHKLIILMTLNSTGVLVAMNPFQDADWFAPTGLVKDLMMLMISEAIVGSLTYILSPLHMIKLLRRWLLSRAERSGLLCTSQIRANAYFFLSIFENVPVDMAQRHANIFKILFLATTFCVLEPFILVLAFVAIACTYWTDKV